MSIDDAENSEGYLTGQLLIAMPSIGDDRFERSVIYMCAHSAEGAMGIVINKLVDEIDFEDLLGQLGVESERAPDDMRVHFGGPVETGRGFVLHTADYLQESTLAVNSEIGLTATIDILRSIAGGEGPKKSLFALGYAGWAPGQLDGEIQANGWLNVPADMALLFDTDLDSKWTRAIETVGIDVSFLSSDAGHA